VTSNCRHKKDPRAEAPGLSVVLRACQMGRGRNCGSISSGVINPWPASAGLCPMQRLEISGPCRAGVTTRRFLLSRLARIQNQGKGCVEDGWLEVGERMSWLMTNFEITGRASIFISDVARFSVTTLANSPEPPCRRSKVFVAAYGPVGALSRHGSLSQTLSSPAEVYKRLP